MEQELNSLTKEELIQEVRMERNRVIARQLEDQFVMEQINEKLESLEKIYKHFNERTPDGVIRRFDGAIKARNNLQDLVYKALSMCNPNNKNRNIINRGFND